MDFSTTIAGFPLYQIIGVTITVIGGGLAYLFFNSEKGQKTFSKAFNNENPVDEMKLEEKTEKLVATMEKEAEEKAKNSGKTKHEAFQEQELSEQARIEANNLFRNISQIEEISRGIGKLEEREKGENSEKMYNMVALSLLMSGANLLILLWMGFG